LIDQGTCEWVNGTSSPG